MNRVIAVVACGLTLAACTSGAFPGLFAKPEPKPVKVVFQSQPAAAEAKTSIGPTCVTPCELAMDPNKEFSVTFTLKGYQPQTIPVAAHVPEGMSAEEAEWQNATTLVPNPVVVTLEKAKRAPVKKRTPKPRSKPAPKPSSALAKPAPKSAAKPQPAKPATAAPAVPPAAGQSPWPPLPQ
jgi:hypothetical protein